MGRNSRRFKGQLWPGLDRLESERNLDGSQNARENLVDIECHVRLGGNRIVVQIDEKATVDELLNKLKKEGAIPQERTASIAFGREMLNPKNDLPHGMTCAQIILK